MFPARNLVLAGALLGSVASAAYTLTDSYDKSNFFTQFEFFSGADPTNGFVTYVDAAQANSRGLAGFAENGIYMGVDYKNATVTAGRGSVRVSSKKSYTTGLFIADISHMPESSQSGCGLWPAWWTFGPNWPNSGEIDIIEGVNSGTFNQMTLHTSAGCTVTNTGAVASTKVASGDCQGNNGCGQQAAAGSNYGAAFNAANGGVYAMEWTTSSISVWFWPRSQATSQKVTSDTIGKTLDTSAWPSPLAKFVPSGCNFASKFMNHNIVFDTTFCGDWAGATGVWGGDKTCSKLASTCQAYVAANGADFADAYWLVNSVKVYNSA